MARENDQIKDIANMVKEAYEIWIEVMNGITDGAFNKGYRKSTAIERMQEWDALTPEQLDQLKQTKGNEWLISQGVQIERIRKEVSKLNG